MKHQRRNKGAAQVISLCGFCRSEIGVFPSCLGNKSIKYRDGTELPSTPFNAVSEDDKCQSCGVSDMGMHHPGCDLERCPRCNKLLLNYCDCGVIWQRPKQIKRRSSQRK